MVEEPFLHHTQSRSSELAHCQKPWRTWKVSGHLCSIWQEEVAQCSVLIFSSDGVYGWADVVF